MAVGQLGSPRIVRLLGRRGMWAGCRGCRDGLGCWRLLRVVIAALGRWREGIMHVIALLDSILEI